MYMINKLRALIEHQEQQKLKLVSYLAYVKSNPNHDSKSIIDIERRIHRIDENIRTYQEKINSLTP